LLKENEDNLLFVTAVILAGFENEFRKEAFLETSVLILGFIIYLDEVTKIPNLE